MMSLTRMREIRMFTRSALEHLAKACEDFDIDHNRSVEQAVLRLQDIESRLAADIDADTQRFVALSGRGAPEE